ncbi:MAG: DUF2764 family protein [Deltaproteobacteria bacterium]|nr:DUF2764 family protein [Deltaproteobacteria bacterium]MBW2136400.1 DUF2764 family protein [Deltaproteobacteria bacterium]
MGEYYYIVSSLPYLSFQDSPPFSHEEFLEGCDLWLSNQERAQLGLGLLDVERIPQDLIANDLLLRWVSYENTLRNELVRHRARNLGIGEEKYMRERPGLEVGAAEEVHKALQLPSLREKEIALLEIRWDFLSDMEPGHYFDLTALIIYGLKLQILERMQSFSEEKGRQLLKIVCERNLNERP